MKRKWKAAVFLLIILSAVLASPSAAIAETADDLAQYHAYRAGFDVILVEDDISASGFHIIESQIFDLPHAQLGALKLIPAIHEEYGRLALFFAAADGSIAAKTDDFMANSWRPGQLKQANRDVICISCVTDLDGDGLEDVIVISTCQNDSGAGAEKAYPVGDVLFQNETGYYRDPRISDKINRFDMNKSAEYISAFLRDGVSMECLFVAKNLNELAADGCQLINYLRVTEHLEKFGVVEVVPAFFNMMGQSYLMVYLADQSGNILWNFQPMRHYDNFYDILAISLRDIDGDGNKDLTLLARYAVYDENGASSLKTDYDIYYQRAGYFLEDTECKANYACGEDDDIDTITGKARAYWGWPQ